MNGLTDDEDHDHAAEMESFIEEISAASPELGDTVIAELEALRSIYDGNAVRRWKGGTKGSVQPWSPGQPIRYEIVTSLSPPHDTVEIRMLVTLPSSYPAIAPPQLQLLSRYIGAFAVDSTLFGAVIRTYISSADGVEWTAGEVAIFDGVENVRERCSRWYGEELSQETARDLAREKEHDKSRSVAEAGSGPTAPKMTQEHHTSHSVDQTVTLPEGMTFAVAEPIVDRKSVFIGRACRISSPSQIPVIVAYLLSDRRIARAAHPVIRAWRCQVGNLTHQDNDDDGESAAGGRLAHLLQILDVNNVLVIVTRYFGGIHLGPDRFKHINQAARDALEVGGFLDVEEQANTGGKGRHKGKK